MSHSQWTRQYLGPSTLSVVASVIVAPIQLKDRGRLTFEREEPVARSATSDINVVNRTRVQTAVRVA